MGLKLKGSTSGSVEYDVPSTIAGGDINFTLPGEDGAANQVLKTDGAGTLGWMNPGVLVDNYILTLSVTSAGVITNWARPSGAPFIGGANNSLNMTVASGEFSFPSSGYYQVLFQPSVKTYSTASDPSIDLEIQAKTGGGYGTVVGHELGGVQNKALWFQPTLSYIVRVPAGDVATARIQFNISGALGASTSYLEGGTTQVFTQCTFIKLGDV